MKQSETFDARIKIRTDGDFHPVPGIMAWDGRKVRVNVAWKIREDETSLYHGEFACTVDHDYDKGDRFPRTWIASGDLVRLN